MLAQLGQRSANAPAGLPLGKLRRDGAVGVAELFLGPARCAAEVSSQLRAPQVGPLETRAPMR